MLMLHPHDIAFLFDIHPLETVWWFTNSSTFLDEIALVATLFAGGRLVIQDCTSAPIEPARLALSNSNAICHPAEVIARHEISVLVIEPALIDMLVDACQPSTGPLRSLRVLGSTGILLDNDNWLRLFKSVGHCHLPVINSKRHPGVGYVLGNSVIERANGNNHPNCLPGFTLEYDQESRNQSSRQATTLHVRSQRPGRGAIPSITLHYP